MARPKKKDLEFFLKQGLYPHELKLMGVNYDRKMDDYLYNKIDPETRRLKLMSLFPKHKNKINYYFKKALNEKKPNSINRLLHLRMLNGVKNHFMQNGIVVRSMCKKTLELILDYSMDDLAKHLNISCYTDLKGYEIDHILPKSSFKTKSIYDNNFKKCWSLKNLQLLTTRENREKWNG